MSDAKMGGIHRPPGIGPGGGPGGGGGGSGCPQPSDRQSPALGNGPPGLGTHLFDCASQANRVALQYGARSAARQWHFGEVSSERWLAVQSPHAAGVGSRLRGQTLARQTQHGQSAAQSDSPGRPADSNSPWPAAADAAADAASWEHTMARTNTFRVVCATCGLLL